MRQVPLFALAALAVASYVAASTCTTSTGLTYNCETESDRDANTRAYQSWQQQYSGSGTPSAHTPSTGEILRAMRRQQKEEKKKLEDQKKLEEEQKREAEEAAKPAKQAWESVKLTAPPGRAPAWTRDLASGMTGDDVRDLQTRFKRWGYDVDVTGTFDDRTHSAVESFQANLLNERADGIVDARTRDLIGRFENMKPRGGWLGAVLTDKGNKVLIVVTESPVGGVLDDGGDRFLTEDHLLTLGGDKIKNEKTLMKAQNKHKPGESVLITFERTDREANTKQAMQETVTLVPGWGDGW